MSISAGISVTSDLAALDDLILRMAGIEAVVVKYAEKIAQEANRLAPRDTGALAASIHAVLEGMSATIIAGEGLPDIRAVAMEYGNARVPAQSYMRPAVERYAEEFIAAVQAALSG